MRGKYRIWPDLPRVARLEVEKLKKIAVGGSGAVYMGSIRGSGGLLHPAAFKVMKVMKVWPGSNLVTYDGLA